MKAWRVRKLLQLKNTYSFAPTRCKYVRKLLVELLHNINMSSKEQSKFPGVIVRWKILDLFL